MNSEDLYYTKKAAALDPLSYTYIHNNSFNLTVPAGEQWGVANAWFLKNPSLNSGGLETAWFHRDLDVD